MPRKRRFGGRGLDRMPQARKEQRTYNGKIGSVNTLHDVREWLAAATSDRSINNDLRRKRIQNLYAITHSKRFVKQWRGQPGDLDEARKALKRSYQRYMVR